MVEEYFISQKENLGDFIIKLGAPVQVLIMDEKFLVQKGETKMEDKTIQEFTGKLVDLITDVSNKQAGAVKEALKQEIKSNTVAIAELQKTAEASKIAIKSAADEIASLKTMLGEDAQKLQKIINVFKQLS